jgi:hypothetical protein
MSADVFFTLYKLCLIPCANVEGCRQIGMGRCSLDGLVNIIEKGAPMGEGSKIGPRICAPSRFDSTVEATRFEHCISIIGKGQIREARLHSEAGKDAGVGRGTGELGEGEKPECMREKRGDGTESQRDLEGLG